MASETLDVRQMSVSERIVLMERLWESMSSPEDLSEPPEWHESVLRDREAEWRERHAVSQDWAEAREEIRRQSR